MVYNQADKMIEKTLMLHDTAWVGRDITFKEAVEYRKKLRKQIEWLLPFSEYYKKHGVSYT